MTVGLLKMIPCYQARPWGGRRIRNLLGEAVPSGPTGEAWVVSPLADGLSRVAEGPMRGRSLVELAEAHGPALLGRSVCERYGAVFPLLVKLIDVSTLASVQVHPNDGQAIALEGYPRGKTEAWYLIDRTPDAVFYAGFRPGVTGEQFRQALAQGGVPDLLQPVDVQPGQCLFVPPGLVHACGNGVFMLEVQQCCDLTYRVYDWDRIDAAGNRRELHVEKAVQVIDFGARPAVFQAPPAPDRLHEVLSCPVFRVYEATVTRRLVLPAVDTFLAGTVVDGHGVWCAGADPVEMTTGDSFVVPANTPVDITSAHCRMVVTAAG